MKNEKVVAFGKKYNFILQKNRFYIEKNVINKQ